MTRRQILDSSKLKAFADDNLKFDENDRKLFEPVEKTVGKGEIAHYKQFLLFPQCFQKACFPGASKGVIVWEWVKLSMKGRQHTKCNKCWLLAFAPFPKMFCIPSKGIPS